MQRFSKKGILMTLALLALGATGLAAGLIRWQPVEVTVAGNTQVNTTAGSWILNAITINTVTASGVYANLQVFDSATGLTYGTGVIRVLNVNLPTYLSTTSGTWGAIVPLGGIYFKNGIVADVGSNTVDATYYMAPAN